MALTKAEISEKLYELGFSKSHSKVFVEHFFDEVKIALVRGESVKLSGFGNFEVRNKGQRPGRNPKTGVEVPITARKVVTFKAGQKLRTRVLGVKGGA